MSQYVHLIRGKGDPERRPRVPAGTPGSDPTSEWRKTLKKDASEVWEARILEHLSDGRPRTFNAIGVELLDKTADILHQLPPDKALWDLVTKCQIEHTSHAPIYFRVKGSQQDPTPGKAPQERRWTPGKRVVGTVQRPVKGPSQPKALPPKKSPPKGASRPKAPTAGPMPPKKASRPKPSAAPALPQGLIDDTIPRTQLQELGYRPIGKSSELRPFGYQIVVWYDPKEKHELYEYVPQGDDPRARQLPGPRITVHELAAQVRFHKAIGAPLPEKRGPKKRRGSKPPAPAPQLKKKHVTSARVTPKSAKEVYVLVDGSPTSVAAVLWTLAEGRLDPILVLQPDVCVGTSSMPIAPVTIAYLRSFAKVLDLRMVEEPLAAAMKTYGNQDVLVVSADGKKKPDFEPVATPFRGKNEADVWSWLDRAGIRPHPAYLVGLNDPCMPEEAMRWAASRAKPKQSFEKALAVATLLSGDFPDVFTVYDGDEKRETA